MKINQIIQGDCLEVMKTLESESIDCVITSPPYWGLRDYGVDGQLGLEKTPEEYVENLVNVFREVKRVLKKEGTLWLNLGDSYASKGKEGGDIDKDTGMDIERGRGRLNDHQIIKPKDLVGIPWRVAFALQADGWYLRQDIIWHKPNPMPESVTDRCTKSHEYIFLLAKSPKYYFNNEAIKEDSVDKESYTGRRKRHSYERYGEAGEGMAQGFTDDNVVGKLYEKRNKRSVWTVTTKALKEAHFATFPEALIEPMILAGCPKDGIVLDVFMGAGTTAVVAKKHGRNYLGIELNAEYIKIAEKRINGTNNPLF